MNSRRQQERSDRESRRQQRDSDRESRRQQERSDFGSWRQQELSDFGSRRQQRDSDRRSRGDFPIFENRGDDRRNDNEYQGYKNYGQFRSAEVHERNRQRQTDRNFWRTRNSIVGFYNDDDLRWRDRDDDDDDDDNRWWRNRDNNYWYDSNSFYYPYSGYQSYPVYNYYQPVTTFHTFGFPSYYDAYYPSYSSYYDPYYSSYEPYYTSYYGDPYYPSYANYGNYGYNDYYGGGDWKMALVRTVVSLFLGGGNGGYYDDRYAGYNPYDYASSYPSYVGSPSYYYSSYPNSYASYVPQYGVYSAPGYANYNAYVPSYNSYPYGSYDPYAYANYDDPYGGLFGMGGSGLTSSLIQRAVGMGYYQGFLEGQAASRRGWGDQYYNDPYQYYSFDGDYVDTYYDPYSSSMGDNRRVFSEGYELGYRDALAGNRDLYEDLDDSGNIDLVSLLLGSGLSLRN